MTAFPLFFAFTLPLYTSATFLLLVLQRIFSFPLIGKRLTESFTVLPAFTTAFFLFKVSFFAVTFLLFTVILQTAFAPLFMVTVTVAFPFFLACRMIFPSL